MAFLKPSKEKEPATQEAASPAPASLPLPAPPPPAAPKPVPLLMARDGGLNGRCWRGGEVVTLDPAAADWFLANGHATVAK